MCTCKVKVTPVIIAVVVVLVVYAFLFFRSWDRFSGEAIAARLDFNMMYKLICEYREKHGRWPERLDQTRLHGRFPPPSSDPISGKPWLYFPNAKPGTRKFSAIWCNLGTQY